MDGDHKPTCLESLPIDRLAPHSQGKEELVMPNKNATRSVALRFDQITENDLQILAKKARAMIETGSTPPTPKNKVRAGKRLRVGSTSAIR